MKRLVSACLLLGMVACLGAADDVNDHLKAARIAMKKSDYPAALKSADAAVKADGKNVMAYFMRGEVLGAMRQPNDAIKDFEKAFELDNTFTIAIDRRGGERFKQGLVKESIDDFDAFLKKHPKEEPGHWRRGISYYYVGKFAEGAKQFDDGRIVFGNDVENAFWHWLCLARKDGADKATKTILEVGKDGRVPMMKIYDLIKGKATPDDVIKEAQNAKLDKEDANEALFYANLYLGLYYEGIGKADKAQEHLAIAVDKHKISHYMWDVGNVHLKLMKKK